MVKMGFVKTGGLDARGLDHSNEVGKVDSVVLDTEPSKPARISSIPMSRHGAVRARP
jgi:hypothetical protein